MEKVQWARSDRASALVDAVSLADAPSPRRKERWNIQVKEQTPGQTANPGSL